LTNGERKKAGLPALKINPTLTELARDHSAKMAAADKLAHTLDSMTYVQRAKKAGYPYLALGENVAWNQQSPAEVVESWMQSPGHRANILNKDFTEIGVGIAKDADGHPFYTQDFARPVKAGATEFASFSITNETHAPVSISIPDQPTKTVLDPGGTGMMKLAGMGQLPKVNFDSEAGKQQVTVRDRGTYVIREKSSGSGIEVSEAADGNAAIPVSAEPESGAR
jgi:hypothetical protein